MSTTKLACLTPPGTAAIATLALRGPAALTVVRELANGRHIADQPGRFFLRRLGESGLADEVVVVVKQITPEPWLELHCHGGLEVVRLLIDLFAERGVEMTTWPRLELATADDPFRATALRVVANAPTARTAAIGLDQYHGAFTRAIETIGSTLQRGDRVKAEAMLADLSRFGNVGRHLNQPWRVVIAGAPNVGKSSLVNALAGYQRCIVSPVPGTTRDVVTTLLAIDGWPVEVADTAGWRSADAALEREGIARAQKAMAGADLCLWLLDSSAPPVFPTPNLGTVQFVVNKIDLPPVWSLDSLTSGESSGLPAVRISAHTAAGLEDLCAAIAAGLVQATPPPGQAVPFTPQLAALVSEAFAAVRDCRTSEALENLDKMRRECD